MAWWTTLADRLFGQAQPVQNAVGAGTDAYSAVFPLWEQNAPTYPIPNAWSAAQIGYNKNELVYACIQKRAVAVSEPPLYVYDQPDKKARKRIDAHPVRDLLSKPNQMMGEVDFWQTTEIFTNISGFAAWEIEFNNSGDPIGLWPMRPHWCSFLARKGQPVAFVRYQPDGLPAVDVPIDRVLLFMELDPLKPQIRPLSRTSVAMRVITSDNAVTDFVTKFFQQGASMAGVLKTQQSLNEAEATRIRSRWRDTHGGLDNWGDIAVLGQGTEFQPTSMTFQEMDFANVDGRDEARICAVFGVPPIIINAKVGLSAATYSNYQQARQAFYEETISPRWQWYESIIDAQLLPKFGGNQRIYPGFDTSVVKALQEDRQLTWQRATQAASTGIITRDEARQEMGFDSVDGAEKVFIGHVPGAGGMKPESPTANMPVNMPMMDMRPATGVPSDTPVDAHPLTNLEPVKKALGNWRRDLLAALKSGAPVATPDDVPDPLRSAITADLRAAFESDNRTAGDVRAVFERHWPHESATKAKGVDAPADEADRRRSEREMQAALVAYFDDQLARIAGVLKG